MSLHDEALHQENKTEPLPDFHSSVMPAGQQLGHPPRVLKAADLEGQCSAFDKSTNSAIKVTSSRIIIDHS